MEERGNGRRGEYVMRRGMGRGKSRRWGEEMRRKSRWERRREGRI